MERLEIHAKVDRDTTDAEELIARWAIGQLRLGRKLVALIPPTEAHDGPRYAGYYCEDAPDA